MGFKSNSPTLSVARDVSRAHSRLETNCTLTRFLQNYNEQNEGQQGVSEGKGDCHQAGQPEFDPATHTVEWN